MSTDSDLRTCAKCKQPEWLVEEFDSYACLNCNQWAEKVCGDAACSYCSLRPPVPAPYVRGIEIGGHRDL